MCMNIYISIYIAIYLYVCTYVFIYISISQTDICAYTGPLKERNDYGLAASVGGRHSDTALPLNSTIGNM
jgi:hypothetical protein